MKFEPIAIIGQSCILPGALTPGELWDVVLNEKDQIKPVPDGYWRVNPELVLAASFKDADDLTWTDRGGYVHGFESVFDPSGFAISPDEILVYDKLVHWLLHCAREALQMAGYSTGRGLNAGVIFGNLSYPTHSLTEYAESIYIENQGKNFLNGKGAELLGMKKPHALNRFMSGLPAGIVARALNLNSGAFALDAACASSLYAIKLACDRLHNRSADIMLAGGVQRSDDLLIHIGFCTLQAMSRTGQSRPFHKDANGLVPAEGAGFVALKRLDGAVADGDNVLGVIRGVGLSNDGRGHGLLVPSEEGQKRAMYKAYEMSGLKPEDISMIECHATGTTVGDGVEIRSMKDVFRGMDNVPIGSIKSNLGHPITVSGIAGVIKVLGAMEHGIRPSTLHVEKPLESIKESQFRLLTKQEPWDCKGLPRAAISNFGFGGNNAHAIVEKFEKSSHKKYKVKKTLPEPEIVIVSMGTVVANTTGVDEFAKSLFTGKPGLTEDKNGNPMGITESCELPLIGLNFPPTDLDQTLSQQLLVLKAAMEAIDKLKNLPEERTGVLIGMGCDSVVGRSSSSMRVPHWADKWIEKSSAVNLKEWISQARDTFKPIRKAASVVGAMPNIPANRICSQFNLMGSSFTVSAEELSGIKSLEIAVNALKNYELDAFLVGAVDVSCEPVHIEAVKETLDEKRQVPGDGAVVLILKRLDDATRDGDTIYAVISNEKIKSPDLKLGFSDEAVNLSLQFGHAHAASGLLHVASAALSCYYRALPAGAGKEAAPVFSKKNTLSIVVEIDALGGESASVYLKEDKKGRGGKLLLEDIPGLYIYSGKDKNEVLQNLKNGMEENNGTARLVIAAPGEDELEKLRNRAISILMEDGENIEDADSAPGIYYCEKPVKGELAFVFTGSAGTYRGMGKDLLFAFPEFKEELEKCFPSIDEAAGWIFKDNEDREILPEDMLWGSSYLSQLHASITRDIFGLKPDAAIGFSSGESNSLFAMGAWNDMDKMYCEFKDMGVFTKKVGGSFDVIKKAWEKHGITDLNWVNRGLMVTVEEAEDAIKDEPMVRLLIINAPGNIVIGGEEGACERVVKRLGSHRAYPLGYDVAVHCPEIEYYKKEWYELHKRKTTPVPGIRFYTGSTFSYYEPSAERSAEAILGMASHTLDFPEIIKNAWDDGVRIFIEHGPRDGCTRSIREILKDREHIAVPMDRGNRSSISQMVHAMAQLIAIGFDIKHEDIINKYIKLDEEKTAVDSKALKTYAVHPQEVKLPPVSNVIDNKILGKDFRDDIDTKNTVNSNTNGRQYMEPAPVLRAVLEGYVPVIPMGNQDTGYALVNETVYEEAEIINEEVYEDNNIQLDNISGDYEMNKILKEFVDHNAKISTIHKEFISQQAMIQQQFLELQQNGLQQMMNAFNNGTIVPENFQIDINRNDELLFKEENNILTENKPFVPPVVRVNPEIIPANNNAETEKVEVPLTKKDSIDKPKKTFSKPEAIPPKGPTYNYEQLKILASGKISEVFGPMFNVQDEFPRQVRLPEEPLLLAHRVTGLDAEPGSMGTGIIWTETDVKADAWYMTDGYMPAGIIIESGQCDLTLVSYLGADFQNMGERVYRLLGCDLMYYDGPPKVGDTLCYEIHIDGHANVGDTRIFFFHYDCRINGEIRFSVRNAQAGFFSDEELANSGGILWEPETGEHKPDNESRVDRPIVECARSEFSDEKLLAFSEGKVLECFGPGFERAETHSRTPKIHSGQMLLLDRIAEFDPEGGPWKRGYVRAEFDVEPDAWFLVGHFKNDPCMPGTLMSDACSQTLIFYLAAMGYTLKKDGWRFDLVPEEIYEILCRGQVTPSSKKIIYEAFIEEVYDSPYPTVYADILATCDGRKILHIRRMAVHLVPDWPLDHWVNDLMDGYVEERKVAKNNGMEFGYRSMLACAFGKPSEAFGELGRPFDNGRHIARLPGPPYHFMTRVSEMDAVMGDMQKGHVVEVEYDVPSDVWYFDENGNRTMPFCVLMEVALQPCGWLAVFGGGPETSEDPLFFRNLDGNGTLTSEIFPDSERILTRTTITNVARIAGQTLINFDAECFMDGVSIYKMRTGFGFFPEKSLAQQIGLEATDDETKWLDESNDFFVELTERPEKYYNEKIRLPESMLLMIDRVTGFWPKGGGKGFGRLRAEKTVNVSEWFFKSHFFHDPVQPGSLGVEAMVQLLQFYMIHENMHEGMKNPRFQPIALDSKVTWKYRGQVSPDKKRITIELNIMEHGKDDQGVFAVAEAWLWVDNLRIFNVDNLKTRIVDDEAAPAGTKKKPESDSKKEPSDDNTIEKILKNQLKERLGFEPSGISIDEKNRILHCESMPFNHFPLVEGDKVEDIKLGDPVIDFDHLFSFSRSLLGIENWFGENFARSLYELFTRCFVLDDPEALKAVKGKPAIYLANHQIQIESLLFPIMIQTLSGIRTVAIANSDHLDEWMGPLNELLTSYPGINYPSNVVYFNQQDRDSMFDIIKQFKTLILDEGISVFLHIEGKLGLSCREPVKVMSSVFVDMALEMDIPIVPVRFTGGLPVKKLESTLDFPLGYGKQDYFVGKPIPPHKLSAMPYADRRNYILNSINNLGCLNELETPNEPNNIFKNKVEEWMKKTGVPEVQAVFYNAMERMKNTAHETKILLQGVKAFEKLKNSAHDSKFFTQGAHAMEKLKSSAHDSKVFTQDAMEKLKNSAHDSKVFTQETLEKLKNSAHETKVRIQEAKNKKRNIDKDKHEIGKWITNFANWLMSKKRSNV